MQLTRRVTESVYAGRLLACTAEEYLTVRETLLGLMSQDGRLEAASQVAACELQRLDAAFEDYL